MNDDRINSQGQQSWLTGEYEGWPEGWTRPENLSEQQRHIRLRSFRFMQMFNFQEPEPRASMGSYAQDDPVTHWEFANHDVEIISREGNTVVVQWMTGWGVMHILTFGAKARTDGDEDSMRYSLDGVTADDFIRSCLAIDLKVQGVNDNWTMEHLRGDRERDER